MTKIEPDNLVDLTSKPEGAEWIECCVPPLSHPVLSSCLLCAHAYNAIPPMCHLQLRQMGNYAIKKTFRTTRRDNGTGARQGQV